MTQDQVTLVDLHKMWSGFQSTVETLKSTVETLKEKVETLEENNATLEEKIETLKEEVHQMKCITTTREVAIKIDDHLATQLCETYSTTPTKHLYEFDKENVLRDGGKPKLKNKIKNKIGPAEKNYLPLQAIPVLVEQISSLKQEGNKQNHTVYPECVEETVEKIQAKLESRLNQSSDISQHHKKLANVVVRQAIYAAVAPTRNKRHPPASPLVSTSPTKKLKEWPLLSPSE